MELILLLVHHCLSSVIHLSEAYLTTLPETQIRIVKYSNNDDDEL
jgi:hypothetical protein